MASGRCPGRRPKRKGSQFPKKSPRIGPDYQAVLPPLPPLRPRPGSREDKCRKAWGAPADTMSDEDKSMDLFTAQLLTEFRADIPEDEILETLHATDRMGIGYRRFTHARATLAHKVAAKAKAAAATAASAVDVLSLWAKAAIAGSTSISKGAVATAASAEAFTALSGGAPSAAVPSAEASAVASSGASSSSEAADSPSA